LFILGAANSDTDEYDTAVVGHEWGHYYEDKFSRSDSIGGSHSGSAMLDIRLAFGEGFGTALGCMIIDSPFYLDSLGSSQASTGVFINLESGASTNAGWYNETSISKIIYDIFDSIDDAGDTLSLGFTPIHNVFIGAQKNTEAFSSIFTFITALKSENAGSIAAIDAITMNESIASISDIYGTGRSNRLSENANPLYTDLSVGSSVSVVSNTTDIGTISSNKLGAYNFLKFTITTGRTYTIDVNATAGGGTPNPNIYLYQGSSSNAIGIGGTSSSTSESLTLTLNPGTYRMAIHEYNGNSGITFDVALN
jgi:hypothetical protein